MDRGTGVILDPATGCPFSSSLPRRLLDDAPTRQRLADRGPTVVAAYSWASTAAQHLAVYREALGGAGSRADLAG